MTTVMAFAPNGDHILSSNFSFMAFARLHSAKMESLSAPREYRLVINC
jgi:hypothetical protein